MRKRHTLAVSGRDIKGKEVSKLRRQGLTPGIIYGPVIPTPVPVSIETRDLAKAYHDFGGALLIDLNLDRETYVVYIREVAMDRIARQPLHAEFYAPNLTLPIVATVPVTFVGEPGVEDALVNVGHESLQLRGLPEQLPATIEVDLSVLTDFDQAVYVRDVQLGSEVELLTDGDELLVKLSAPQLQEEEEPVVEEAAEAAAETEAEESAESESAAGE